MIATPLGRRLLAEALGAGLLVAAVVGSGIMAERLSPGDAGLALMENAVATGGALVVLIALLGPVSGAHLNPVVSLVEGWLGGLPWREVPAYVAAQVAGACLGAVVANLMFGLSAVSVSTHDRSGPGALLSEVVATAGLLLVVIGLVRGGRSAWVAPSVAAYIVAAYWFTASTSFANPAVAVARTLSDTIAGIAPSSVPGFVAAEVVGAVLGTATALVLWPVHSTAPAVAVEVVAPVD
ncbi:MAG: aquaporin family protein [Frankiales bacterium]|nr:aquaporin family protein [Frankiales bacterium]